MADQTVKFMNGTSKSLVFSLLNKLFKGQQKFSIMPYDPATGVTWNELSFSGADELFTIKDTFRIVGTNPSFEDLQIDQMGERVIDSNRTDSGNIAFEGDIPSAAAEFLSIFFTEGATITTLKGQNAVAYEGQAYFATPKTIHATILIENEEETDAIAFAHILLTVSPNKENNGNPLLLRMAGKLLANGDSAGTQGDWAVATKKTTTSGEE